MTTSSCITDESVCASAPGKVILFGEHAVVYGEAALAASLSDLRIFVVITPTQKRTICIHMPDLPIPIDYEISVDRIVSLGDKLQAPPIAACADAIEQILVDSAAATSNQLDSIAISALTPLIYLIHQITKEVILLSGLQICVRSQDLPVGAGLGSSAAFSVACAAALWQLHQRQESPDNKPPLMCIQKPDRNILQTINQYAFYSEILLHGTPSGIDNAVSTFGGAILFTKEAKTDDDSLPDTDTAATIVTKSTSGTSWVNMEFTRQTKCQHSLPCPS
jgi:mevalonate kinase